jgi:hypothetical protein
VLLPDGRQVGVLMATVVLAIQNLLNLFHSHFLQGLNFPHRGAMHKFAYHHPARAHGRQANTRL